MLASFAPVRLMTERIEDTLCVDPYGKRLFDEQSAARLVPERALDPARFFFRSNAALFTAALEVRFLGFDQPTLKQNADNYGLYFASKAPVPFFWFGLGWSVNDPPTTLPSWGASLEINGPQVARFEDNVGGLAEACQVAAERSSNLSLHRFERHVELARWRPFRWLLGEPDQRLALERFWIGYLDDLAATDLPRKLEAFVAAAG
jgi:hypothetical protein